MKILDRYIIKNFVGTAALVFLVFMALRIIVDLFVNMDEFTKSSGGVEDTVVEILTYYGYQSLSYFVELGGIIILASAAFTIARMNYTNELTAMLASGWSLYRVVWPIILSAMFLCGLVVIDQEAVIPRVADRLVRDPDNVPGNRSFQVWFANDSNGALWSGWFSPSDQKVDNLMVILRSENDRKELEYSGRIKGIAGTEHRLRDVPGWMLSDAWISSRYGSSPWPMPITTEKIYAKISPDDFIKKINATDKGNDVTKMASYVVDFPPVPDDDKVYGMAIWADQFISLAPTVDTPRVFKLVNVEFELFTTSAKLLAIIKAKSAKWVETDEEKYWELSEGQLFCPSDLSSKDMSLRKNSRWLDYMSTVDLAQLIKAKKLSDPDTARMIRHSRVTEPLNNMIMLLLGLPFILSRERNLKASALMMIGIISLFYICVYLCRYVGLSPPWAAWTPILIFGPVAVVMFDSIKT